MADSFTTVEGPKAVSKGKAFQKSSEKGVRPTHIVKEAMRLYPPTRRVHRDFDGELVVADIEECQCLSILSENDPLAFRPERWQNIAVKETEQKDEAESEYKKGAVQGAETKLGFVPFAAHVRPVGG